MPAESHTMTRTLGRPRPDGDGYSIVLISPETNPDHSVPTNWRASAVSGGTPGRGNNTTFTGDPSADNDGDGLTALLEYALGSTQGDAGFSPESIPRSGTDFFDDGAGNLKEYLTLTYRTSPPTTFSSKSRLVRILLAGIHSEPPPSLPLPMRTKQKP